MSAKEELLTLVRTSFKVEMEGVCDMGCGVKLYWDPSWACKVFGWTVFSVHITKTNIEDICFTVSYRFYTPHGRLTWTKSRFGSFQLNHI